MSAREVLESWKDIAAYLKRDVRTCRRWEETLGLPIHRLNGSPKARVVAYKDEVDRWLETKLHEREQRPKPDLRALLKHWPAVAVFAALIVIGAVALNFRSPAPRPPLPPGIGCPQLAVVPFVNGTGDANLDYLSEAVADHLIVNLQRSPDWLTVFSFERVADAIRKLDFAPGQALTPAELDALAARTGAGWVLSGYIGRSGTRLRFDYELRPAGASGARSEDHFVGTEADIWSMEGRICERVRRSLNVPETTGPPALQGCSPQASRFYELGRAHERDYTLDGSPADLDKMIEFFNAARMEDPGCALAFYGLGDAYQFRFVYEGHAPDALRLMNESYRKAYELAPGRAETNIGMTWVHFFEEDHDRAFSYLKKAMAIDPVNHEVLLEAGSFLASVGVLERSVALYSQIIKSGSATADIYLLRAWSYEQLGAFESALADFDRMVNLEPTDLGGRCHKARVLVLMKKFDAAAAELIVAEHLSKDDPRVANVRALMAAAKGDRKAALAAIAPAEALGRPAKNTYYITRVYAALGMKARAIDAIERAIAGCFEDVQDYVYFFPYLNNSRDYFYESLRGEPAFGELLRREERKHNERLEKYGGL
jgi:tetratricopeptide (TPR) repeat protein/TolB-like protein